MLFDYKTELPFSPELIFNHTVRLESAPHWHRFFTDVERLTPDPIGLGSRWRIDNRYTPFELEIVEFQPPYAVTFEGNRIMGMIPRFVILIERGGGGDSSRITYQMDPDIPNWMRPMMKRMGPLIGRWDLNRYFDRLEQQLGRAEPTPAS